MKNWVIGLLLLSLPAVLILSLSGREPAQPAIQPPLIPEDGQWRDPNIELDEIYDPLAIRLNQWVLQPWKTCIADAPHEQRFWKNGEQPGRIVSLGYRLRHRDQTEGFTIRVRYYDEGVWDEETLIRLAPIYEEKTLSEEDTNSWCDLGFAGNGGVSVQKTRLDGTPMEPLNFYLLWINFESDRESPNAGLGRSFGVPIALDVAEQSEVVDFVAVASTEARILNSGVETLLWGFGVFEGAPKTIEEVHAQIEFAGGGMYVTVTHE